MAMEAGTRIGPYEVLAPLGAGGMGEVYRARDTRLGRDVALKLLPAGVSFDRDRLARFEREARLLASLNHPNIAAIHELEESSGAPCLVLELVPGETLAEKIAGGPLPIEETVRIGRQIARALEAAHENGVLHRDLKPANIKVTPDGTVKVLDFGLAKVFSSERSAGSSHGPTLTSAGTREGVLIGTAGYMSPERARGQPLDRRTDIWSFGCVLYEALTGERAFPGETVPDTLASVVAREPRTSARSTTLGGRARRSTWSWSCWRARRCRSGWRKGRCLSNRPCVTGRRSPTLWTRRTGKGSCIGTSSPAT